MEINVCGEYRPCLVAGRKALSTGGLNGQS